MPVRENLAVIRDKIAAAKRSEVTLVAVSKMQDQGLIEEALEAGLRVFGENRVQEAYHHWEALKNRYPDLQLHLIGLLQTNKVKDALALFDVIETVDRPALVDEIVKNAAKIGKNPVCFIQVNTGAEPQKAGCSLHDLPALVSYCRDQGLNLQGLMCIPPVDDLPAFHFALLKKLATRHNLPFLSMGMSADYERALELGATHIRVGTALFGARSAA